MIFHTAYQYQLGDIDIDKVDKTIVYPKLNNKKPKLTGVAARILRQCKEINKVIGKINREGLTIVPTKVYFKKGKAKVELAIAKGKKLYDKRHVKKKRDWQREQARILSRNK